MLSTADRSDHQDGAALCARLAGFAGFLRANGYALGAGDLPRVLETAQHVGVFDGLSLRWSLQSLLCSRGAEWRRFDGLFDAYFLRANRTAALARGAAQEKPPSTTPAGDSDATLPIARRHANEDGDDTNDVRHGASHEDTLKSTDFGALDRTDQAREIELLMRRFARRLKRLQTRRETRSRQARRIDLQTTIRNSVGSGGSPFRIAWKAARRIRPRLVLVLDVSRSMSAYSFFYLRLARELCAELTDVYCFIFHTRITPVTDALRDADPWRSQERLHLLAEGWGGGTRIGECVREFNRVHAQRCVHSRTGVIIMSDGFDTGEPEVLANSLIELRKRARRIVWLNPLLNQSDYRPEARAMQAALPHLDWFAPGADLNSLERLLPLVVEALR
jgi:uncharacterized protein with von Willebrand factor type A (vWA) domain